jgi:AcrR family transcriptional regulator
LAASTKERIVEAALLTLKEEGFAGTSARAVARRGGFNQALIFYHFGTLTDLLLAALDKTSRDRMNRYTVAMSRSDSIEAKIQTAAELYAEDLASGHITVLSELVTGSLSRPDLGPEVGNRLEPWVDFAEQAIKEVAGDTPLSKLLPSRTLAFAVVALYLGVDLLSHLDGDNSRAKALFDAASRLSPLLDQLVPAQ